MKTVEVRDSTVLESDEQVFAFGAFLLDVNGETCRCPLREAYGAYGGFDEFTERFDAEAMSELEVHYGNEMSGVETETEKTMEFPSTSPGVVTETAAKQIIERMTHFHPQHEPTEKQKETAKQACTVAKELGWDDAIPDEEDRIWYELN